MPNSRCEGVLETGFGSSPFLPFVRREIDKNNFDELPRRESRSFDSFTQSEILFQDKIFKKWHSLTSDS